ncbi:hypothetical protein [Streptomyces europaeiscabiei]|uniref:hypothetical protein n=1 Tax=Streptomyces europaeiscabiei TaxID=146819 RepID=UPI000766109E|nr:hypothetical protein [Streptomyces europaeiscabiei]
MHPRSALSSRIRKTGAAVRAGLFLVLALIALTLAAPTSAYADFACSFTGDDSYHQDSPGSNGEAIIAMVKQWETDGATSLSDREGWVTGPVAIKPEDAYRYTLYELNGMRGLNWSMTFKGREDASQPNGTWGSGADSCQVMAAVNNSVADLVFNVTKLVTRLSISVKEMASNPSPFEGLYSGRDDAVETLRANVLVPAVPVMIMLVGFWVFSKWRKGDMREVWAGVSWTALSTIAVIAFLGGNNYHELVKWSDDWIGRANSALTSAVLSGVSGEPQSPCDIPTGKSPFDDDEMTQEEENEAQEKAGRLGLRLSSCAMYDTLAFRPWAMGQFGGAGKQCIFREKGGGVDKETGICRSNGPVPDALYKCYWGKPSQVRCADLRVRQAVAQSWTNVDTQRQDSEKNNKFENEWQKIRIDISGGVDIAEEDVKDGNIYPVAFADWAGKNATDRVGIAFYSLVAALIVGVMVLILSALTLLWHAVTLILVILLPLVAALGIHPSQQKLLKGWLETFVHAFVLRAGFGVILTILLVLYQMILPANIALATQLLMLILVTVAVVMMLKKLLAGNFSPEIAGGGGDALGIRDTGNLIGDRVVGKGEAAMVNTAKASGRVVSKTAKGSVKVAGKTSKSGLKGTAWTIDRFANKGRGRAALQKRGWLGQSKREQQQTAYWTAKNAAGQPNSAGQSQPQPRLQEPEGQSPDTPKRSGRVSGAGSQQTPQNPPTQQPEPQPTATRPRTQAPEPSPAPRPATPPAPAPAPAPRDPRTPDGRV